LIPKLTQQQQALVDYKTVHSVPLGYAGQRALDEMAKMNALCSHAFWPYSTPQPTHTLLDLKGLNSTVEKDCVLLLKFYKSNINSLSKKDISILVQFFVYVLLANFFIFGQTIDVSLIKL